MNGQKVKIFNNSDNDIYVINNRTRERILIKSGQLREFLALTPSDVAYYRGMVGNLEGVSILLENVDIKAVGRTITPMAVPSTSSTPSVPEAAHLIESKNEPVIEPTHEEAIEASDEMTIDDKDSTLKDTEEVSGTSTEPSDEAEDQPVNKSEATDSNDTSTEPEKKRRGRRRKNEE